MTSSFSYKILIAFLLLGLSAPGFTSTDQPKPSIRVTGEGVADIAPDMAVLELTVLREAPTARAALDANSAAMEKVLAAMRAEGIEARDLQTANFSIQPKYHYPPAKPGSNRPPPELVGYTVRNSLNVRVRNIANVGAILDKSVTLGVNQGGNIRFTNADPSAAIEQARINAVTAAMAKVKTLASAAGVKPGDLLEISEQSYTPQPIQMARSERMMASDASSVPIATGENSYRVRVNIAVEILQ
ncbi:MAG: SIMPL domain-containing protein [Halioglobus sp.]